MKKKPSKQKTTSKRQADSKKPLPKTFQGAVVVRAVGMDSDDLDDLLDREALDHFEAARDMFVVLPDRALHDFDDSSEVRGFVDEKIAIRYAQAQGNGNVDYRVLRITQQTLVVGTMNDL